MSAHTYRHRLAMLRVELDEEHARRGQVLCGCGQWVDPDDAVDGTCGATACLRADAGAR